MPSKSTTKRVKYAHQAATTHTDPSSRLEEKSRVVRAPNSKVLELPLELLMEILSYFKAFPKLLTPEERYLEHMGQFPQEKYLERTDALRALSQTCKLWRDIFFPMAWERIDACATHSASGAWYKVFGESLIKKSILVTKNPEIAHHVKVFTILLSRYSMDTVLPALIETIKALPNLHTLQIIRVHNHMTSSLKRYFDGHTFPQIRTVVLPTEAHNILKCCPEARKVVCINGDDGSQLIGAISKCCRKVEELVGFNGADNVMRRIPKAVPNLRSITFSRTSSIFSLKPIASMKHIRHISLHTEFNTLEAASDPNTNFLPLLKSAKEIIQKSSSDRRKTVTVYHTGWDYLTQTVTHWTKTIGINDSL